MGTCRRTNYGMMTSPATLTTTMMKRPDLTSSSGGMGKAENPTCWDRQSNTKTSSLLTSFSWFFSIRPGNPFKTTLKEGCTNFPKIWKPPPNSRRHKDDMKQVSYRRTRNIRRHRAKFSCHGNMAPVIRVPLP